jgi:hypothetical protein
MDDHRSPADSSSSVALKELSRSERRKFKKKAKRRQQQLLEKKEEDAEEVNADLASLADEFQRKQEELERQKIHQLWLQKEEEVLAILALVWTDLTFSKAMRQMQEQKEKEQRLAEEKQVGISPFYLSLSLPPPSRSPSLSSLHLSRSPSIFSSSLPLLSSSDYPHTDCCREEESRSRGEKTEAGRREKETGKENGGEILFHTHSLSFSRKKRRIGLRLSPLCQSLSCQRSIASTSKRLEPKR